jgi:cytosine deaminase
VHADFGIPVERSSLELLCEVTHTFGLKGRVAAGHCTTLALMDDEQLKRTIDLLAAADVAIMALPRTDLFLDGHVAPLELLRAGGVRTFIGTNNVQNAFTPVGRPSLPSAAAVYALARQQGSKPVLGELAELLWTPLSLPGTAISVGVSADLCVWPCQEAWQMVASEAEPMAVFVAGVLAHSRQPLPRSIVSPVQGALAGLDLV